MTEQTPDAPGGERAQDEPITCATPMCGYVVTTVSEFCAICNLKHAAAASPRPAEPEPPKAEQELERTVGPKCINCGERDGGYEIGTEESGSIAGPFCASCFDEIDEHYRPKSQPKAAAGTLEGRIEHMLASSWNILPFQTVADLLRDALTELRRRQEERDSAWSTVDTIIDHLDRHCRALHHQTTTRQNVADLGAAVLITDNRHVRAERERQMAVEGWTPEHDDEHVEGEMRDAAIAYLEACDPRAGDNAADVWPWEPEWFKPRDAISNLVRAGALIAAEIDRLQRQEPK